MGRRVSVGRWLGLNVPWGNFGIHGTLDPYSVGWASSHGCIRMNNNDDNNSFKLHQNLIKNLEKKLKDIKAKELLQWEAQSDPNPEKRMPQEIFKQLNAKLQKEKKDVQQALKNAYKSMPEPVNYQDKIIKLKEALSALRNPDVDAEEKNRLLKVCIDRITYTREKPQRLSKGPDEKKGTRFKKSGGYWSNPPLELEVKLNV